MLSPPLGESVTEDEDEDEMPLGHLRERLARRTNATSPNISLGLPGTGTDTHKATILSPQTRRHMSKGCLLVVSKSTPMCVGVESARAFHGIQWRWLQPQ